MVTACVTNAIQHRHTGYWHCQGPENTTRQIHKIHTVNHVPNAPLARVLSGSTFKSGLRAPPLPHTRRAAPRAAHRCRRLAHQEIGRSEQLLQARAAFHRPTTATPPLWPPPAAEDAAFTVSTLVCWLSQLPGKSCKLPRAARQMV